MWNMQNTDHMPCVVRRCQLSFQANRLLFDSLVCWDCAVIGFLEYGLWSEKLVLQYDWYGTGIWPAIMCPFGMGRSPWKRLHFIPGEMVKTMDDPLINSKSSVSQYCHNVTLSLDTLGRSFARALCQDWTEMQCLSFPYLCMWVCMYIHMYCPWAIFSGA